jgi:hypothetical protein
MKVRISGTPTKRVRISGTPMTGIGTQGPAATPNATMMAMGGSNYVPGGPGGYGNQQKGHGYALDLKRMQEGGPTRDMSAVAPIQYPEQDTEWRNGMMRGRMATADAMGNTAAHRMVQNYPPTYTFTGREQMPSWGEQQGPPAGATGTHFLSSMGDYAVPFIQEGKNGKLKYKPNASFRDKEAMRFNNDGDAEYFANHYKEVAPMMREQEYQKGGKFATGGYANAGASRGYGMQQGNDSYALNRFWSSPAGYPGATSQVDPFARVGTVLPESKTGGDINAEKNERILGDFDQDGQLELMNVGGPSHAEGGKDVDVPSHSFVFSDTKDLKIKDPGILAMFGMAPKRGGYTPADIAKKYDLNKYKAVTSNPNADDYASKTAQLMSDNYTAKLSKLAQVQEQMKGQMGMEHHDPNFGQQPAMSKYGGVPRFDGGGQFRFDQWPSADVTEQQRWQMANKPNSVAMATNPAFPGMPDAGRYDDGIYGYRTKMVNGMNEDAVTNPYGQSVQRPQEQIDRLPQSTDVVLPEAQQMSYVNVPDGPDFGTGKNKGKGRKWNGASVDPNFYGNLQNALQIANLRKFQPYEPVPQAVIPDTVFMDPTRAIAAQQEEARSGSDADQGNANPQAARAMSLVRQGIAGKQAADTIGQYHNQNVQIANQANERAASITNDLLSKQANRLSELNKAGFLADRDYQREMGKLQAENVNRYQKQHDNAVKTTWLNKTSPYFNINPVTQMPDFKSADAQAKYLNTLNGVSASSTGNEYQDFANDLKSIKAAGITDPAEVAMAVKHLESKRSNATYDAMGRLKQFRESGYENPEGDRPPYQRKTGGAVKGPLMKMGGTIDLYNKSKLAKFMK